MTTEDFLRKAARHPTHNYAPLNLEPHRPVWVKWVAFAVVAVIVIAIISTATPHTNNVLTGFFYLGVVVAIYFLPTIIACRRGHRQVAPIAIINTFLGWTLIGFVVALAWAFMDES